MIEKLSSKAQVALWLSQEIGEGTVFTKHDLRAAFPQFEQADRRMRDLRQQGWRIDTNREDATLRPNELRLVTIGEKVWEPGSRRVAESRLSPKVRAQAISAAGFQCQSCGAQLGDRNADRTSDIRLKVVQSPGGTLVACEDCAGGIADAQALGQNRLLEALEGLNDTDFNEFRRRSAQGDFQRDLERALALAGRLSTTAVSSAISKVLAE